MIALIQVVTCRSESAPTERSAASRRQQNHRAALNHAKSCMRLRWIIATTYGGPAMRMTKSLRLNCVISSTCLMSCELPYGYQHDQIEDFLLSQSEAVAHRAFQSVGKTFGPLLRLRTPTTLSSL